MVCCGRGILDGAREELEGVCDVVFGGYCGLDNIIVPLFHIATDDIGFCGCIHNNVASILVEGRAYDLSITAA